MKKVIVVFDIGKTNKKIFLFDEMFNVVYQDSIRFKEIVDDDNDPCDDIESIEKWIQNEVKKIQNKNKFQIKAINFSTHGATLVYLNNKGKRVTPLYNYLKPIKFDFNPFYKKYGGIDEFSRKTASPAYGMLNSGLQIYWLKEKKPHLWTEVKAILHYPQYLSYLFTHEITSDFTSTGAHTATWDFDNMKYHSWLKNEGIILPEPKPGKTATLSMINGQEIAIGKGLHDSSSSIIPLLEKDTDNNDEFILLSTGTWIICMNPFSKEKLSAEQLKNDCLCFMTPDKRQIKSSMQFLGHMHEVNTIEIGNYFNLKQDYFLDLKLDNELCAQIFKNNQTIYFANNIEDNCKIDSAQLNRFNDCNRAYYQLVYEICQRVCKSIARITDKHNKLKTVYISGGFNKNRIFVEFLRRTMPDQEIKTLEEENASALGAAMLMKEYL